MLVASAAIAVANVVAEALVVERAQGESQEFASHLQSVVWGFASVGGIISSFLSGKNSEKSVSLVHALYCSVKFTTCSTSSMGGILSSLLSGTNSETHSI
jgi:hypothetical protein